MIIANDKLPAICGNITASNESQRSPVLAIFHATSMRNTGMIVENTGNIILAIIKLCNRFLPLNLYLTKAYAANPASKITTKVTETDIIKLLKYALPKSARSAATL